VFFIPKFTSFTELLVRVIGSFPFWAVVLLNVLSSFFRHADFVNKGKVNETKGIIHGLLRIFLVELNLKGC
jgi:hypothetical protein